VGGVDRAGTKGGEGVSIIIYSINIDSILK